MRKFHFAFGDPVGGFLTAAASVTANSLEQAQQILLEQVVAMEKGPDGAICLWSGRKLRLEIRITETAISDCDNWKEVDQ